MAADREIDAELLAERNSYLREMQSDLQDIESLILDLSLANGAAERKQKLARKIHTIKGVAGSYGLDLMSAAAHRMEDLLAGANPSLMENNKFVDSLLAHNDQLAAIAKAYLVGDERFLNDMRREYHEPSKPQAAEAKLARGFNRVMIVEPSLAALQLCMGVLKEFGAINVSSVQDGYEALGWLLKEEFDAVITSLQVPTIDGQSLFTVLRAIPGPNMVKPVILLTASSAALDPARAQPEHIIQKDVGLTKQLRATLTELVNQSLQGCAAGKAGDGVLRKILLVDDSPEIHNLVRLSFKRFPDVQIVAVADPTSAVEAARNETPDLILLDVQMTPISGKEVMRDIKATPELSDLPVAFFTGTDDPEEKKELASLGAWQIFKKPFSPKTFSDHLLNLFRER
ncbi:MAG TPA: response regulator [Acidobacteriota bacterium]|jgi:CheY-like chemotaxis protein|nr:response regulator [Acidobacteriota bacterium]